MKNFLRFQCVCACILFTFLGDVFGEKGGYSVVRRHVQVKENSTVTVMTCKCAGKQKMVVSKEFKVISDFTDSTCDHGTNKIFCDMMKSCEMCTIASNQCTASDKTGFCVKSKFSFKAQPANEIPHPKLSVGSIASRSERSLPGTCSYPSTLKTADIACTSYPNFITCKQRCIFGHTFRDGIKREMSCKSEENVWKPVGFEECHPFIDCNLSLVSTGAVDCITATTTESPACNVTCDQHEDKQPVAKQRYECKITGQWTPRLPFCVISGSEVARAMPAHTASCCNKNYDGLDLVPAPQAKSHISK